MDSNNSNGDGHMIGEMFEYLGSEEKKGPSLRRVLCQVPILYQIFPDGTGTACVECDIYSGLAAAFDLENVFKPFFLWRGPTDVYHIKIFNKNADVWRR